MTKQLQIGSHGFHCKAAKGLNCQHGTFINEIRRGLLNRGARTKEGGFRLRDAISRKQCEIEPR